MSPSTRRLFAVLGALLLVACSGPEGQPAATGADPVAPAADTAPAVDAAPADSNEPAAPQLLRYGSEDLADLRMDLVRFGDLDALVQARVIRALVVPSKTYYFLDGVEQRGVTYEALRAFEVWLNEELDTGTLKVHVVIVPASRETLFQSLVDGRGDIAASGLTITDERLELVDFSDALMRNVDEVAVTGPAGPTLRTVDDLAGQEVYVRESSSYYESLQALNERFRAAGKPEVKLTLAEELLEDEDLLQMADAGIIGTIIVDRPKAEVWAQIFQNIVVHPGVAVRTGGRIAWAFRKDSPQLAAMLNRFVATHGQGTLFGNMTINRYFKDPKVLRNALADGDLQRYAETIELFRRFAPEYGFDALMAIAQGYQESRLDQSLRSPRGAVGIMQLLPDTAADKSVGIPDIATPEANIHAGIRYMRWIRDTYFDDPAVSDFDKALFALASYNAGPNRIVRLRATAAQRGFDPNVWFRNVEVIAAEDIGRETVDYVSNIYKYYAAYRLLSRRAAEQ